MSARAHESFDLIAGVLAEAGRKGVKLWAEGGKLHYRAPRGALTREEKERLSALSTSIVAFLEMSSAQRSELKLEPRRGCDRVPLTFSQLAHWRSNRLVERRTRRSVASATRLRGKLDLPLLHSCIAELVHRHEALRTRIIVVDGIPEQHIAERGSVELDVHDLSGTPESLHDAEVERLIRELIVQPVDVTSSPLFAVRLVRLGEDEHVLMTATEHIVSDGYSRNILLRDLFSLYLQASRQAPANLPPIPIQFADYAVWQAKAHPAWLEQHGQYWRERLAGTRRLRCPENGSPRTDCSPWQRVPVRIEAALKQQLSQWCRLQRTTLPISVFAAFAAMVLRWSQATEAVIGYQTDGRDSPLLENTIGYFAAVLNLRLELRDKDRLVDFLEQVTHEYCMAHEHADHSYVDAQIPRPAFIGNPGFNWIPRPSLAADRIAPRAADGIACTPVPFTYPLPTDFSADYDPSLLLFDHGQEIVGSVSFPLNRFAVGTMAAFARDLLLFVTQLMVNPQRRVRDMPLST